MSTDITHLILTMKLKEATKNPYFYIGALFLIPAVFMFIGFMKGWWTK